MTGLPGRWGSPAAPVPELLGQWQSCWDSASGEGARVQVQCQAVCESLSLVLVPAAPRTCAGLGPGHVLTASVLTVE